MSTVTGSLTAIGQRIVVPMDGYLFATWKLQGTYAGLKLFFEASVDGVTWFILRAQRSNDLAVFEDHTFALTTPDPAYAWFQAYNAFPYISVRCVDIVSGSGDFICVTQGPNDTCEVVDVHASDAAALSIGTSAAQTTAIAGAGVYDLLSDTECFVRIDPSTGLSVTTGNGYRLLAGNAVPFRVAVGDKIAAIMASGSGSLRYQRTHA